MTSGNKAAGEMLDHDVLMKAVSAAKSSSREVGFVSTFSHLKRKKTQEAKDTQERSRVINTLTSQTALGANTDPAANISSKSLSFALPVNPKTATVDSA